MATPCIRIRNPVQGLGVASHDWNIEVSDKVHCTSGEDVIAFQMLCLLRTYLCDPLQHSKLMTSLGKMGAGRFFVEAPAHL